MAPRSAKATRLLALVSSAIALLAGVARAGEVEAIRFTYDAPVGCPTEAEFLEAVSRDGGHLARVLDDRGARAFAVAIESASPAVGRLTVRDAEGREAVRSIRGERCEDLAQSLAVLVALSLQPRAMTPAVVRPEVPPRAAPEPGEDARTVSETPRERWRLGVSTGPTLTGGASPGALLGLALSVEAQRDVPGVLAPAFRLGAELSVAQISGGSSSSATSGPVPVESFSRRIARFDACPLRWMAAPPWSRSTIGAQACARFDGGVLDVRSSGFPGARSVTRAWAAAGAILRIRSVWSFVFLDVEGGMMVPVLRERFFVEPASEVYEVPPVAGVVGLEIGGFFL
jgi:hypothetical protein